MDGHGRASGVLVDVDYKNGVRYTEGVNEFITAKSHAALTIGQPVVIDNTVAGPTTAAPAALAVYQYVGVVCETATAADEWVKVQIKGFCEANVDGDSSDVTPDDYVEVIAAGTAFVLDHATVRSTNSVARAVDGNTGAAAISTIYLLGDRVIVAAS